MRKFMIIAAMGFAASCLMPITASFAAELSGSTSKDTLDIFGRRGADDPKGHIRGEGAGHPVKSNDTFTVARRGADDPKGHIRGEGAGHPLKADAPMTVARRGQAEPGDDRGNHGAGHPVKSTIETTSIG